MQKSILLLCFCAMFVLPAKGADICEAIALRDVSAIENPNSILRRGEHDTAITQYRVNKKSGKAVFCSHGGYCYPANALKLTNCKIGARDAYNDPDDVFYSVDVLRSKVSKKLLRYDDLDNWLLAMGLCSACASNAANQYLTKPRSRCAQTVKEALEGNPASLKTLQENTSICD